MPRGRNAPAKPPSARADREGVALEAARARAARARAGPAGRRISLELEPALVASSARRRTVARGAAHSEHRVAFDRPRRAPPRARLAPDRLARAVAERQRQPLPAAAHCSAHATSSSPAPARQLSARARPAREAAGVDRERVRRRSAPRPPRAAARAPSAPRRARSPESSTASPSRRSPRSVAHCVRTCERQPPVRRRRGDQAPRRRRRARSRAAAARGRPGSPRAAGATRPDPHRHVEVPALSRQRPPSAAGAGRASRRTPPS